MADLVQLSEALQKMDIAGVKKLTEDAIAAGIDPQKILSDGLIAGMDVAGGKFKRNEIFIPEMLVIAKAMNEALAILKPKLIEVGAKPIAKAVIGTVKGDVHDIGKNMLGMMLEGAGLEVIDLGYDVPPEKFVEAIKDVSPQILGMSALLSTTMVELPVVIDALKEAGIRDQVKVIVGGAPVTQKYADDIGADGYGDDAATGADVARKLI
jgi:5-methyltetrahydrofolate--homocysteine methyltransferase